MKNTVSRSLPADGRALGSALLLAAAGGFLNGLIGTGAGILFLPAARLLGLTEEDPRAMYAFSMACVIPVTLFSCALHPPAAISGGELRSLLLPALIGGGAGAVLRDRVKAVWLNRAFAALTILSGTAMLLG